MRAMKATIRWPVFWLAPAPKNPKSRHQSKVGNKESVKGLYAHPWSDRWGSFLPNAKSSLRCHMDESAGIGVSQHPAGPLPHRGCGGPHPLGGFGAATVPARAQPQSPIDSFPCDPDAGQEVEIIRTAMPRSAPGARVY